MVYVRLVSGRLVSGQQDVGFRWVRAAAVQAIRGNRGVLPGLYPRVYQGLYWGAPGGYTGVSLGLYWGTSWLSCFSAVATYGVI